MSLKKIERARFSNLIDTSSNWETYNPLLLSGEVIIVLTNSGETRFKVGDGVKTYTQLPFADELIKNSLATLSSAVGEKSSVTLYTWEEGDV